MDIVGLGHVVHHPTDIGKLAHARGLNDDAVGMIGVDQVTQGLGEIAHQRAADAAGIQLGDLDARILHEAAVNAHLAVFVLQQHYLFAFKGAFQQLLDQCRLAGAQKTGNDVYLCHFCHLSCL